MASTSVLERYRDDLQGTEGMVGGFFQYDDPPGDDSWNQPSYDQTDNNGSSYEPERTENKD